MGQALGNIKNVNEADLKDLSTGETMQRGLMGAGFGALKGLNRPQPVQSGGAAPIQIGPAPQYDFSQIGNSDPGFKNRRNPFYGGY